MYEIVGFDIYPYQHSHKGDGEEHELENKSHNYSCEAFVIIKEV